MNMKSHLNNLAIFGGTPLFSEKLHVGRPNIGNREALIKRIDDLLDRRWFSNNGPYVQEFERRLADITGVKHCIAMCNGTVALEIAIRAIGLTGEVILPSFTFIATAHALQWQQITPIFCDIDPHTHIMNPAQVEKVITPQTSGIIGVHVWGRSCNVEALTDVAHRNNLKLLFDAAHAFGCTYRGTMIGNFGDAEIFSFHATKFLNTFEGGAVVTNNDELAEKIRLMRNFGFAGYDNVVYIGINGKMTEVSAAMGITSLESMQDIIAVNYRNYRQYLQELSGIPGVNVLRYDEREKNNYHYVVIEVDEHITKVTRDQLYQILWAENILVRSYFFPGCHKMEPYKSNVRQYYLPHTDQVSSRVLTLPTGTSVSPSQIKALCQLIRLVIEHRAEVRAMMDTLPD